MEIPELRNFSLVGGTALSLCYGHRKSIDLDLFSNKPFDNPAIIATLEKFFKKSFVNRTTNPRFGIFGFIDEVKINIIRHPHPLIRPELNIDGIRMFSTEDIIAMKVQAILGRGKRKDFWDVAELLNHYSISDYKISCREICISKFIDHCATSPNLFRRCRRKRRPGKFKKANMGKCEKIH